MWCSRPEFSSISQCQGAGGLVDCYPLYAVRDDLDLGGVHAGSDVEAQDPAMSVISIAVSIRSPTGACPIRASHPR